MPNYFSKKLRTLRHMSWSWALHYYKKRFLMNANYFISKIRGRTFWEMAIEEVTVKIAFSNAYQHHIARAYHTGESESQSLTMWKHHAEERGGVILDVGGYIGVFGLLAGSANPNAKIFIFEPDPTNIEQIKQNIALNHLANVSILPMAITDTVGTINFNIHSSGGKVGGGTHGSITKEKGNLVTPCTTIDAWTMENHLTPTLIKMDIEGAEYRALLGARQTLMNTPGIEIFLELHPHFLKELGSSAEAVLKLIEEFGYRKLWLDSAKLFVHHWLYRPR